MRALMVFLGAALWPLLAWPQDVPLSFRGTQFIDAQGCVFLRDMGKWQPRQDRDGHQICGFPPTPLADADEAAPPKSLEELLQTTLAEGLRDGDLTSDRRDMPERKDPLIEPAQTALQDRVTRQVQAMEAVRAAVAAAGPQSSQLCAKLGYVPSASSSPIIGADVTQGLCPGMRAPLPKRRLLTEHQTAMAEMADPKTGGASADKEKAQGAAKHAGPAVSPERPVRRAPAKKASKSVVADRRVAKTAPQKPDPEMIPPNARFVQVGAFADDRNATITIRNLSQLGYRVAQGRIRDQDQPKRLIMAGPFRDRRALILALNQLRANGYPGAFAR